MFIGKIWGMNLRIAKWAYNGIIIPKITYASSIWVHRLKVQKYCNILQGAQSTHNPRLWIKENLRIDDLASKYDVTIMRKCSKTINV